MTPSELLLKYRRIVIVVFHAVLLAFAFILSFLLRFEFAIPPEQLQWMYKVLPVLLCIKTLVFYYFGVYYGLWRYVSINDMWQIFKASVVSSVLFVLLVVFFHGLMGFPRTVFILDFLLSIMLVSGVRFFTRLLKERFLKPVPHIARKRVLIVGAGRAGMLMAKEIRENPFLGLDVVGFIDDDRVKRHQKIDRIPVLGMKEDIPVIVAKNAIEEIILAIPSVKGERIREILSYCERANVRIRTIPRFDMLLSGNLLLKPREVRPEDLLGRELITIDEKDITRYLKGKRVLVTGAGGSIGSELCKQIAKFMPSQLCLFDHNENDVYFLAVELANKFPGLKVETLIGDVKDIALLKHAFSRIRPQVLFHAAAHKHVPLMEANPVAAVKNNVIGTRNLIYAAGHYKVERFVLISTDKAVNPINVMGMSKRIAEMIMQGKAAKSRTKFMAVRFGNVIGSAGSVVPLFKRQIEDGGPLTVTHPDVERYFMCVSEAVSLVLQAGSLGTGGEIFILDMGEQVKITEIARNLIALSGFTAGSNIAIKYVGLRAGEKLSEELLLDAEKDFTTKHNKIFISHTNYFDPVMLRRTVKELEEICKTMNAARVVKKMVEIVNLDGTTNPPRNPHEVVL